MYAAKELFCNGTDIITTRLYDKIKVRIKSLNQSSKNQSAPAPFIFYVADYLTLLSVSLSKIMIDVQKTIKSLSGGQVEL